jgi:hypothetical protein
MRGLLAEQLVLQLAEQLAEQLARHPSAQNHSKPTPSAAQPFQPPLISIAAA